ncbi:MAG: ATP-binding protein [Coleofasciculaceae cyanobacterium SM2_1_6]|nr:ATP-binding protein [Coleofasciculaceae cyanobacterium SM2_1_6]
MRREKFLEVFDSLPTKRKQVLLGILRGDIREKIMLEVGISEQALTQHRRQLYKDFQIEVVQNEADDPGTGERKLPQLMALCAKYKPELFSPKNVCIFPKPKHFSIPNLSTYEPTTFTGREELISDLLSKLQGQTRLVWITGMSGIGKTTLGECVASRAWESDRAFQWVHLEILEGDSLDFGSVAAKLLTEMGDADLDPHLRNNPEQIAQRLIQSLKSSTHWIQLDSLERLLNPEQPTEFLDAYWAVFLQRCLTESDLSSRLVLTSQVFPTALMEFSDRYPKTWAEYRLAGLEGGQRLEFFVKRGIASDHNDILTRIAQTYEGHPLVLKVMAEEILQEFAGDVLGFWREYQWEFEGVARELSGSGLAETEYNEALDRKVRERLKKSLLRLPKDALDLLCRSAVFRRPVPKKFWLAMLGDRTPQEQKAAYGVLGDHALIEKEGRAIRQHNLIRDLAYNLLKANPDAWEAAERQAAHLWLTEYKPAVEDANLEKVRGYLEAFNHYCEIEDWEQASDLYTYQIALTDQVLHWQLWIWGYFKELMQVSLKLVDNINSQTKRLCLNQIGNAHGSLGNIEKSIDCYQQALQFTRKTVDRQGEGAALGNLGLAYYRLGQYERAINFLQQQLTIAQEIGDHLGKGVALGNLGNAYYSLGQYERAINFLQQYLTIAREIGDRLCEDIALGNLGNAYYSLGQYDRAINFHQQKLTVTREIGDRLGEGAALGNLGNTYHSLGQYEQAINFHQQSLTIAREIGELQGEGAALVNMGATQIKLEQYPESLTNNQTALEIFREIGLRVGEAEALKNLAEIYQILGEVEVARQYCQQGLALARELGIPLAAECEALLLEIDSGRKGE